MPTRAQPVRDFDADLPSPVEDAALARHGVRLLLKRDDLMHPEIPGNKWRKLKYNLAAAQEQAHFTLLTFGGAYSNHLRAVAAAGHSFGFNTIGVVRGEEHAPLNWSLGFATNRRMRLTLPGPVDLPSQPRPRSHRHASSSSAPSS